MQDHRQHRIATAVCLLFSVILTTSAAELQDGAGSWHFSGIFTPSALRKAYYNQDTDSVRFSDDSRDSGMEGERLIDVFFAGEARVDSGEFALSSGGGLSGDVTGSALLTKSKTVKASTAEGPVRLLLNASADVMVVSESTPGDENEFTMLVRRPTDAVTADLTGNWQVLDFGMPDDLTESFYNFLEPVGPQNPRQTQSSSEGPQLNENLVDVFFRGGFEIGHELAVEVMSGGTFSGSFSGTSSTTANGTVSLVRGDGTEVFQMNNSKNVMIRSKAEPSFDDQRFTALIKKPSSLSVSELAGPWRFSRLAIPNRLVETVYNPTTMISRNIDSGDKAGNGEELVNMFFPGLFEVEQGVAGIGSDGRLTAGLNGSVVVNSPGVVTITVDGEPLIFYVNDTKDVMLHVGETMDEQQIIAVLRVPLDPMEIALDTDDGKLNLLWVGRSDVKLQKSSTLTGWSDVSDSTGQSAFESSTTTAEFYRLVIDGAQ